MSFQGIILFISTGAGMVELDFCCSGAVAREMRKSLRRGRMVDTVHPKF